MALIETKCPSCGGAIQLDNKKEFGFCLYCGTRVILSESIPQRVKIEGFQTLDDKLANAEAYIKLEEYDKAFVLLNQITEEFTCDYRAWWLLAKLLYWFAYAIDTTEHDFGLVDIISTSKEFQHAMALADEDAKKVILAEYEIYLQEIRENKQISQKKIELTINGDYTYINHCHMVNYGFEVINGELYFWEDKLRIPPDLRIEKTATNTLNIKSIHNGHIVIGDRVFIMSNSSPDGYIRFCQCQEECKKERPKAIIKVIVAIASLIFLVGFLLKACFGS